MKLQKSLFSYLTLYLTLSVTTFFLNSCRTRKGPEVKESPPPISAAAPVNTSSQAPSSSSELGSLAKFRIVTFNASAAHFMKAQNTSRESQDAWLTRWAGIIRKLKPQILLLSDFDPGVANAQLESFKQKLLVPISTQNGSTPDQNFALHFREVAQLKTEPPGRSAVLFSNFPIAKSSVKSFRSFARADIELPGATLDFVALLPEQFDLTAVESNTQEALSKRQRYSDDLAAIETYIRASESRKAETAQLSVFVAAGNLAADPFDGPGGPLVQAALQGFLSNPLFNAIVPKSKGATIAAALAAGANISQTGPSDSDTARLDENTLGNLRLQYLLPSKLGLKVESAGVFWPAPDEPEHTALDPDNQVPGHFAVYADLSLLPAAPL